MMIRFFLKIRGRKKMNLHAYLSIEEAALYKQQKYIKERLGSMPDGRLSIVKNGRSSRWKHLYDKKPAEPISKKNLLLAEELAYKCYLEDCLTAVETRLEMIHRFLLSCPSLPVSPVDWNQDNKDLHSLLLSYYERHHNEQPPALNLTFGSVGFTQRPALQWLSEDYKRCPDHPEHLIVPTLSNIMVRSKSEALIADVLFRNHVPFRYEAALSVNGITVYPDFTIFSPNSERQTVIWEHFGLMGSESYAQNMKTKLSAYLDTGYLPGIDLIMTFERKLQPLDINYVRMLAAYHFG